MEILLLVIGVGLIVAAAVLATLAAVGVFDD